MENNKLNEILYSKVNHYNDGEDKNYENHYLEQYKMYLNIFMNGSDRRNKSNEFFLGLNTAIIGVIGYLETKNLNGDHSIIFLFAPFVGIAICYSWYQIILTYRNLNRAKFKVIHEIEEQLPLSLFKTEWELLGRGQDKTKYKKLSSIEKNIPIIFLILYAVILMYSLPWNIASALFH